MSPGQGPALSPSLSPAPSLSPFSWFFGWTIRSPLSLIRPFWNEHPSHLSASPATLCARFLLLRSWRSPPSSLLSLIPFFPLLYSLSLFLPFLLSFSFADPTFLFLLFRLASLSVWCGGVTAKGRGSLSSWGPVAPLKHTHTNTNSHTGSLVSLALAEWLAAEKKEGIPSQHLTSFPLSRPLLLLLLIFNHYIRRSLKPLTFRQIWTPLLCFCAAFLSPVIKAAMAKFCLVWIFRYSVLSFCGRLVLEGTVFLKWVQFFCHY